MQCGIFYQLPCAPQQSMQTRYRQTLEQIVYADALGFDSVWLAEAHFNPIFSVMPRPLTVAAALAAQTTRIRLGIGVSQLPLHHPLHIAEEAATVDMLSDGRLEFGAGRGTWNQNFETFGVPWEERSQRLEEALDIIERAWTSPRFSYHGAYYDFDAVEVVPKPIQQPCPPIHIAANSPSTAIFTGRRGYRVLMAAPIHPWPDDFLGHLKLYRDTCQEVHGSPTAGGVSALFFVYPGNDRADVRDQVAESLAHHPIGKGLDYAVAEERMAIYGHPDECIAKIRSIQAEIQCDQLLCALNPGGLIPHDKMLVALRRLAEEVLPAIRDL